MATGKEMKWYKKLTNRNSYKNQKTFLVEESDEITDEIEKSLWLIKEALDLPTEEIEKSVESRKSSKNRSNIKNK